MTSPHNLGMITIPTTTLFLKYMSAAYNTTTFPKEPGHHRKTYSLSRAGQFRYPSGLGSQTNESRQNEARRSETK
jgi:hypothetical protein